MSLKKGNYRQKNLEKIKNLNNSDFTEVWKLWGDEDQGGEMEDVTYRDTLSLSLPPIL